MRTLDPAEPVNRFAARLLRDDVNMHGFMLSVSGRTVACARYAQKRKDARWDCTSKASSDDVKGD